MSEATSVGQIGLDLVVNKKDFNKQMSGIQSLATKVGKKLAAAPRLGFNVSSSCIVCNNKGINRIRFTKSYIAFLVVCSTFRVQDKNIRLKPYQFFARRKIISDMDAVNRS